MLLKNDFRFSSSLRASAVLILVVFSEFSHISDIIKLQY